MQTIGLWSRCPGADGCRRARDRPAILPRVTTRLEKFRGYMARLAPAANPLDAVREGLYVPRPGRSTADEIAARLELDPTSSHLVVGGIGSGKTTQLLVAHDRLSGLSDTHAEYVDISEVHDISRMESGALLVIAGLMLGRRLDKFCDDDAALAAGEQFRRWAHGHVETYWIDDDVNGYEHDDYDDREPPSEPQPQRLVKIKEQALLSSPQRSLEWTVDEKSSTLALLCKGLRKQFQHIVLLLDSLDRLSDVSIFAKLVEQDVRAIREAGIGVVLVGPLRSMFGANRPIVDHFQHFYPQPAVDVHEDSAGRAFMVEVLRKRAPTDLLTDEACVSLAILSGGVLRDLISLARAAGEEAYMSGADKVEPEHIATAADAFGRKLIFGLSPDEIDVLQRVKKSGGFVQTSDQDLALLVTRRVLEYQTSSRRFEVHPTLLPLLEQLASMEHKK